MPVQSTVPEIRLTRPEIYFGELTNTDVYVKTRQKEFNYPQGETNNFTTYEGTGGIQVGVLAPRCSSRSTAATSPSCRSATTSPPTAGC